MPSTLIESKAAIVTFLRSNRRESVLANDDQNYVLANLYQLNRIAVEID